MDTRRIFAAPSSHHFSKSHQGETRCRLGC
jgi:hypothetical protein